jgi:hypothetical protein
VSDEPEKKRKLRAKKEEDVPPAIADIIRDAIMRFSDTELPTKKTKLEDLKQLDVITQEYLKAFVILGYDLNGEKVHIMHAHTHQDKDAIVEHLRTTLINILHNNGSSD